MKIKNNYNCEKCINKKVCKFYDESSKYSEKDLVVKLKSKDEASRENLELSITCKYYNTETITSTYPGGYPLSPYTNIVDNIKYGIDSSRDVSNVITTKKQI